MATIYLSLFFFSISTYSLIHYVLFFSNSVILVALFFTSNMGFITLLIGPMLFLYTRSIITDRYNLKLIDIWHYIFIGIIFFIGIPQVFMPWNQKLQFASEYLTNNKVVVSEFNNSPNSFIPFIIMFFFRPVYILSYLAASIVLFLKHLFYKKQSHVFQHQKFMYWWLSILFILMLILIISHTAILYNYYISNNSTINKSINIIQSFSLVGLIGLLFSPFLFPSILYGLPQIKTVASESLSLSEVLLNTMSENQEQIQHQSEIEAKERKLEINYLETIDSLIESYIKKHQPYLNTDFNMSMLSVLIRIPVHHLAYYFKEYKHITISDYKNKWRINHAKSIIISRKAKGLTLEAIGQMSGFTTRNTFLLAFKKHEGISPKEFSDQFKSKNVY